MKLNIWVRWGYNDNSWSHFCVEPASKRLIVLTKGQGCTLDWSIYIFMFYFKIIGCCIFLLHQIRQGQDLDKNKRGYDRIESSSLNDLHLESGYDKKVLCNRYFPVCTLPFRDLFWSTILLSFLFPFSSLCPPPSTAALGKPWVFPPVWPKHIMNGNNVHAMRQGL